MPPSSRARSTSNRSISAYTLKRAHDHRGASFVEILQNCNIFNDGAFNDVSDKGIKSEHQLILEHGKPLVFGKNRDKGIRMNGMRPEVVSIGTDGKDLESIVVHDETNLALAFMLGNFEPPMPVPLGRVLCDLAPDLRWGDEQANHRRDGEGQRRSAEAAQRRRHLDGQLTRHSEKVTKKARASMLGPFA